MKIKKNIRRNIQRLARAPQRGALPRQFRRPRLLIVGCGDVGMRILRCLQQRARPPRIFALTRHAEKFSALRAAGAIPVLGDLDHARLSRLRGLASQVLHLAPPPSQGENDPRTRHLLQQLATETYRLIYVSTTGVYGDCGGAWVDETTPVRPESERAQRRVAAEKLLRQAGRNKNRRIAILRAPGIYAADRLPEARLLQGLPVLRAEEDVYTNHIHADDLARLCWLGLYRGLPQRAYNACDNVPLKMGDWMSAVAQHKHLPFPPRLSAQAVQAAVSPLQWTFMRESRRINNQRLRGEWRVALRYPDAVRSLSQGEV